MRNFLNGLFSTEVRTPKIDSEPPGAADILFGSSVNANNNTFYGFPTPVNDDWVANKAYVDRGGKVLPSVHAATNSTITLSGTQTVDTVVLVAGNRCLVKDQSTSSQNGVYVVAAGAWTRATDADATAELTEGTRVRCLAGFANKDKTYTLLRDVTTVGTTAQEWRPLAVVDAGSFLGYPTPTGIGHLYYDDDSRVIAVWDGATWDHAGHPIICTSSSRPANPSDGLLIYETDTGLAYIRSGGAWAAFGGGGGGGSTGLVTGMMMMWPTATPPSGWLLCDGTAIPGGNTALIALIGANTPDLRDRVPVGASGTKAVRTTGGVTGGNVTLTTTELPAHTHNINHDHNLNMSATVGAAGPVVRGTSTVNITTNNMFSGNPNPNTSGSAGSGSAFSVQNPYLAVNYIIKT